MSTILYLAAALVAVLTILVVMAFHVIDRLQRQVRIQHEWILSLVKEREKLEDKGDSWKNEVD